MNSIKKSDILIVGSGLFGATLANLLATNLGLKVEIIEKRSHIAGNAYSYRDSKTGIEIHKYGSHIFHTNSEKIWKYINQFGTFNDYIHKVYAYNNNKVYNFPINLKTLSDFFEKKLNPSEAKKLLNKIREKNNPTKINNFEDKALSLIGVELYNAFIRDYTLKQWETGPKLLPSSIIERIPIRLNYDDRYFSDTYQGIPIDGYTKLVENMLSVKNINVNLDCDFFTVRKQQTNLPLTVYSGAIDKYFNFNHGILGWRTLDFEIKKMSMNDFQGTSVINYTDMSEKFTRIHEFKHFHPEKTESVGSTIIMREYPRTALEDDEPYYPMNLDTDRSKLNKYRAQVKSEKNTLFGGRLGSYKYLDMHMAIGNAFNVYNKIKNSV
jgi:UDP-galactopyranose mutase